MAYRKDQTEFTLIAGIVKTYGNVMIMTCGNDW